MDRETLKKFCFSFIESIALSACFKNEIFDTPNNYDKTKKSRIIGELKIAVSDFLNSDGGTDKRSHVLKNAGLEVTRVYLVAISWINKNKICAETRKAQKSHSKIRAIN